MKTITKTKRVCNSHDPFKEILEPLAKEKAKALKDFYDFKEMSQKHGYPINNKGEFVT